MRGDDVSDKMSKEQIEAIRARERSAPILGGTCQNLEQTIDQLLVHIAAVEGEHAIALRRAIEILGHLPCAQHSGENTPPLDEFIVLTEGRCFLCALAELATAQAQVAMLRGSLRAALTLLPTQSQFCLCSPGFGRCR